MITTTGTTVTERTAERLNALMRPAQDVDRLAVMRTILERFRRSGGGIGVEVVAAALPTRIVEVLGAAAKGEPCPNRGKVPRWATPTRLTRASRLVFEPIQRKAPDENRGPFPSRTLDTIRMESYAHSLMQVTTPAAVQRDTATLFRSIWQRLLSATDILLISPRRPDGDSVGSICGLAAALANVGRRATCYCPDAIPETFDGIPGAREILVGPEAIRHRTFDVIVVVDAGDLDFAGIRDELPQWKRVNGTLIVIDHHATNTNYGDVNCVVLDAASTTEAIARMLTMNGISLTPSVATCLLFGLVTDTDAFTNPATSASATATAATLTAAGARIAPILAAVYRNKPVGALQIWGRAFERLRINAPWGVATTILTREDFDACADGSERSEGISNFLQNVLPVKAVLVLKDTGDGIIRGSLRTQRDDIDLGRLAEHLGGGGHQKASGFGIAGRLVRVGSYWKMVA